MIVPRARAAAAIVLALACPAAAQDAPPASQPVQPNPPPAVQAEPPIPIAEAQYLLESKLRDMIRLEVSAAQRVTDLERRNLILEAKEELRDDDLTILQTILGVLGLLLTLLVGGFAFFSYRNAKQEVAHAIREAKDTVDKTAASIRSEMTIKLQDMERLMERSHNLADETQTLVDTIRSHRDEAERTTQEVAAFLTAVTSGKDQPSPEEKQEIADSAEAIRKKPRGTLSAQELLILIEDNKVQQRYQQVVDDATLLRAMHPDDDTSGARSWFNQGLAYARLENWKEALHAYDNVINRFLDSDNAEIQEQVAKSLVNKGVVYRKLGRYTRSLAAYDVLLSRFVDNEKSEIQYAVGAALVNRAITYGISKKSSEAISTCDDIIERFGNKHEIKFQHILAQALIIKGVTLQQLAKYQDAIVVYDEVIRRFDDDNELELKNEVINALFHKSRALGQLKMADEAVDILDRWAAKSGGIDCTKILADRAFKSIRADLSFQSFLRRHGCIGEA